MVSLATELEPLKKLTRDLVKATATLSPREVRYLVDSYYIMQDNRIRAGNQIRALNESGEPHTVINWFHEQAEMLENQIKRALKAYAESDPVGQWLLSLVGIGPVISAGLLAHIDLEYTDEYGISHRRATAGHVWRYAGLDPSVKWEKGKKRPWNASLKVICWKAGQSFMKFQNHKDCFYGKLYAQRKALEIARNESGGNRETAQSILDSKRFGKDTESYKCALEGKLSKGQIDARARRYAVKIFLSHLHEKMYEYKFSEKPPKPFAIAQLGHADYIAPPE